MGSSSGGQQLFTLFVDNLPDHSSQPWLWKLFNKYGVVKDVFIPVKRSKAIGCKFGFIRYDCHVSAAVAIQEVHGLKVGDKKLFVKFASFKKSEERKNNRKSWIPIGVPESSKQGNDTRQENSGFKVAQGKSYAQAVIGEEAHGRLNSIASIQIQPIGFGWLLRSAIAKIRRMLSTEELEKEFRMEQVRDVQIRAIGGRFVIITFPNEESRNATIKERWVMNWFEEIKPWDGEQAKDERFVWLACFGMPLNAWSMQTFQEIGGKWGHVLKVDDNTLRGQSYEKGKVLIATECIQKVEGKIELLVDGKKYIIRVEEEETFRIIASSSPCTVLEMEAEKMDEDLDRKHDNIEGDSIDLEAGIERENEDQHSHVPNVALETVEETNEVNSNSFHGLDSLVLESSDPSLQGQNIGDRAQYIVEQNLIPLAVNEHIQSYGACICSGGSDSIQNTTLSSKDIQEHELKSPFVDECPSLDLVSEDPLINYVEFKRHKKKNRTKQGRRRSSFSLWRHNPLKGALFSKVHSLDQKENNSKRFKLDSKKGRRNDKSLLSNGSFSLGDIRHSEFGSMQSTQEEVSSIEKRLEEEIKATKTTGKNLAVNLLPEDEIILKEMIEEEFKAYSQMSGKWKEIY